MVFSVKEVSQYVKKGDIALVVSESGTSVSYGHYDSKLEKYQDFFNHAHGIDLAATVKNKKEKFKFVSALNIMGQTGVLKEMQQFGLDYGVAISLGDRRDEDRVKLEERQGLFQVQGNVLHGSTWRQVKKLHPVFDLIFARPEGGYDTLPKNPQIHWAILKKAYEFLSPRDGVLITQVSKSLYDFYYREIDLWVKAANKEGLSAKLSIGPAPFEYPIVLTLNKTYSSPKSLPVQARPIASCGIISAK